MIKKVLATVGVILCLVVFTKTYGYIQQDHFECQIVDIQDDVLYFEAYNGNIYAYEVNDPRNFEVGEICKVDFFDFEDFDVRNNAITKVTKIN